jgi:ketosteroid isomerase-like protein
VGRRALAGLAPHTGKSTGLICQTFVAMLHRMADQTQITDGAEVAAALQSFVRLLEDPDPRARAHIYTEDATFAMPGALIEGRRAMLERLESGTALRSVTITPQTIERRNDLAYAYGRFTCVDAGNAVAMRFLMALRRELDGKWRIAKEFLADESSSGDDVSQRAR